LATPFHVGFRLLLPRGLQDFCGLVVSFLRIISTYSEAFFDYAIVQLKLIVVQLLQLFDGCFRLLAGASHLHARLQFYVLEYSTDSTGAVIVDQVIKGFVY
jgi:hypothetical protein